MGDCSIFQRRHLFGGKKDAENDSQWQENNGPSHRFLSWAERKKKAPSKLKKSSWHKN